VHGEDVRVIMHFSN